MALICTRAIFSPGKNEISNTSVHADDSDRILILKDLKPLPMILCIALPPKPLLRPIILIVSQEVRYG